MKMKKKIMLKRAAVCLLILGLVLGALPVQAAATGKADKALTTSVNKVLKGRRITSSTPKEKALKKVFSYVKKCRYERAPLGFKPDTQKNWETDFAKKLLKSKRGSCYHYAAALAFLAKKATDYPVRIGYGQAKAFGSSWQPHAWVEIKIGRTWYTFDANADQFSKQREGKWYQQKRSSMKKIYRYKTAKYINVEI
ncbi:MAG: transglutaminase domain-containing protein [Eubacteriales bacterium]|nr:transglutaminase domain-containing protein [Eubacteriales bacterium]